MGRVGPERSVQRAGGCGRGVRPATEVEARPGTGLKITPELSA